MVIFEIGSGPHLPGMGRKRTLVVLFAGLVIEVVGLVQCMIIIMMRVLIDRCSVLPATHEVCGKLLGGLGVAGGEWSLGRFLFQPAELRIRWGTSMGVSIVSTHLSNSGTFCWSSRMTKKLPSFAQSG